MGSQQCSSVGRDTSCAGSASQESRSVFKEGKFEKNTSKLGGLRTEFSIFFFPLWVPSLLARVVQCDLKSSFRRVPRAEAR